MDLWKWQIAALASLVALSVGCKKDEEDEEEEEASLTELSEAFLTTVDLDTPSTLDDMTQSEVLETMNEATVVYNNQPEDSSETASDACLDAAASDITVKATANKLRVGFEGNVAPCFDDDIDGEIQKATMRVYMEFNCTGGDFSKYDGVAFVDFDGTDVFEKCTDLAFFTHYEFDLDMTGESNGTSYTSSNRNVMFTGSSSGGACEQTEADGIWTVGDCIDLDSSDGTLTYNGTKNRSGNIARFVADGIQTAANTTSVWHESGSLDVTINDWEGVITYSDGSTAPQYSLSNASDEMTGSLTATAGLHEPSSQSAGSAESERIRRKVAAFARKLR